MMITELYDKIRSQLQADEIVVKFKQPAADDSLPLVHIGPHIDLDVSSRNGTLNEVDQQIDIWCNGDVSPADFENYVQKVKWSLSKVMRWDGLTTQTMIDDSIGRDIRRAMLIITITI